MQNPLCKYKDMLGKAGTQEGLRKYRIFGIAILDTTVVIIVALLIARLFRLPYITTIIVIFILGIFIHKLFCVNTALNVMIFGK